MSGHAAVNAWGQWVGYCTECSETITGNRNRVQLWADLHNDAAPVLGLADDNERGSHA